MSDPSVTQPAPGRSVATSLLYSLRPGQWTKNLFVFAGLLFSRHLFDPVAASRATGAFAVFCALSGVVYLINDVADRESDARHPVKARRPIASGAISPRFALGAAAAIAAVALGAAYGLDRRFGLVATAYVALLVLYSGPLKHIVIIDVLTIAIGFVLRVVAGAVVIDVPTSYWLLVCTILLALFLALSKRRHELVLLAGGASGHRRILQEYSPYLLDQMIGVVTASTLMAYIIYATSAETAETIRDLVAGAHDSVSAVRDLPLPLPGSPEGRWRQPVGNAVERSTAARLRRALGPDGGVHHLPAARNVSPVRNSEFGGRNVGTDVGSRSSELRKQHGTSGRFRTTSAFRTPHSRLGSELRVPHSALECGSVMSDFSVRSDSVDVEQIMRQIRTRVRDKRGVDYTEQQIQDLANAKLEKFLDPKGVRSDLLEQYRRHRGESRPLTYAFEDTTLFDSDKAIGPVHPPAAQTGAQAVLQLQHPHPGPAHAGRRQHPRPPERGSLLRAAPQPGAGADPIEHRDQEPQDARRVAPEPARVHRAAVPRPRGRRPVQARCASRHAAQRCAGGGPAAEGTEPQGGIDPITGGDSVRTRRRRRRRGRRGQGAPGGPDRAPCRAPTARAMSRARIRGRDDADGVGRQLRVRPPANRPPVPPGAGPDDPDR